MLANTFDSIFLGATPAGAGQGQVETIKGWIRMHLKVDVETIIRVRQIECHASACPGIETLVAVLEYRRTRRIKLLKPIAEVQEIDIIKAVGCGIVCTRVYPPPKGALISTR